MSVRPEAFIEQAEYLDRQSFLDWGADHPDESTIIRKLTQGGAKLISGPRGCGKTTLMLKAYNKLLSDNVALPVYVTRCLMRIYGHTEDEHDEVPTAPRELVEISFVVTPDETRKIAAFLRHAADEMERMKSTYGHLHLSDVQKSFEGAPHVTVFNTLTVDSMYVEG